MLDSAEGADVTATDDPALLERFPEFGKLPKILLRVSVEEAFLHCPKALMRADLWGETHRIDRASLPTLTEMVSEQIGLPPPQTSLEQETAGLRETL